MGKTARVVGVLAGALLAGAGCSTQRPSISQLDPYVGERPAPVRPLPPAPKPPPVTAGVGAERGWIPPGGISPRWRYIVIHHSGSDRSTPQGMRSWHMNGRGWDELGYHFVIGNGVGYGDGDIYIGQRWTKQTHGAHCKTPGNEYNDYGIGICLIGNLEQHQPTAKQVRATARLVAFLANKCGVPRSRILTHRGVTHKTECPGRYFSMDTVLRQMSSPSVATSVR